MTRHVIGTEGVVEYGFYLEKGALKMPKESVPVTAGFGDRVIGKASDLQRDEESGELSVEIQFAGEVPVEDRDYFGYSFAASNVVTRRTVRDEIVNGDLVEVAVVPPKGWEQVLASLKVREGVVGAVIDASEDSQAPPA